MCAMGSVTKAGIGSGEREMGCGRQKDVREIASHMIVQDIASITNHQMTRLNKRLTIRMDGK